MFLKNKLNKNQLLSLYNMPLEKLFIESQQYFTSNQTVEFCSLISAKTGKCSQNCKYCAQSSHYNTDIKTHPLVSLNKVIETACEAKQNFATRFSIVTSGKGPKEDKDFDLLCQMIKSINKIGLKSCASIGILNEDQVKKLKEANLIRFHHNINTCRSYYPEVCTTHTYDDRINTINLVKKYNIELCCGVIIGMGESVEHRIEMALELQEISPKSIPVNILCPIKNTPFEHYFNKIDEENILKTLIIFKIAVPNAVIRFAGGRATRLSKENQTLALKYAVNGLIIGNMLTTTGIEPQEDILTVEKIGKKICTNT